MKSGNSAYYIKKLAGLIATLLLITLLSFIAFSVIPGDAAILKLGTNASEEQLAALRKEMGLDQNVVIRYFIWLGHALTGNFGTSSYYNRPVSSLIMEKLPTTLLLSLFALILVVVISIPLSLISMKKENGLIDRLAKAGSRVMMSIPSFFLGILIILLFGFHFKVFKIGGFIAPGKNFAAFLSFAFFPALAIALPKACQTMIFLRTNLIKELNKDYVKTLRATGVSRGRILLRHALKNAMLPTLTFIGLVAAELLAGSVIIEQVFSIPGMGRLLVQSISSRDYNVTQAIVLYIGCLVVIINFVVDMLYRKFDPTVKV